MSEIAPDSLSSALDAFEPALKSIDVRTVAVKPIPSKDPWTNLITSIFISEKTVDAVEAEHKAIPKVKNEWFAVFMKAVPFSRSIFDEVLRGAITFDMFEGSVNVVSRKANLLAIKVSSTPKIFSEPSKLVLKVIDNNLEQPERGNAWSVLNGQNLEAKRRHFSDISALISESLVTDRINIGDPRDFEVAVFSGAEIESATFAGSSFKVNVKGTSGLKGLQLNFALGRPNYFVPVWRGDVLLEEGKPLDDKSDVLEIVVAPPKLPNVIPFDKMFVELIHRSVPLNISTAIAVAPLENVVEPFLKTLNAFCSFGDFKKMLFEPEHYVKQPEKIFENAVAWLLSLAGFYTIILAPSKGQKGQKSFDVLRAVETGYEIGSADILAYEDNKRLLLVDCDTGSLYDEKISKLIATKRYFEKSNKFGEFSFVPVLCTPKECQNMTDKGVVIADKYVLEGIFENIAKGNRQAARDIIRGNVGGLMGE